MSKQNCRQTYGVLASGGLGLIGLETVFLHGDVRFVMTDRRSNAVMQFCRSKNVECFAGNPRGGKAASLLRNHPVDVLLSINYLFLVEDDVLQHPKRCAINFHGSLLPRYRGRTPHVWAIINNETQSGVTAHLMESGCDTGDIVLQRSVPISNSDTGATLLQHFESLYPEMICELAGMISGSELVGIPQDHSLATYFPKRTPADGAIDWNWQRERIYNWIRAQAKPYPGAFLDINGIRYHVHAAKLSDLGFCASDANGTVLSWNPLVVKTPNGALALLDHSIDESTLREFESFDQPIVLS